MTSTGARPSRNQCAGACTTTSPRRRLRSPATRLQRGRASVAHWRRTTLTGWYRRGGAGPGNGDRGGGPGPGGGGGGRGPGAGRPAKFSRRRVARDVTVPPPPRHYDLAAEILAEG